MSGEVLWAEGPEPDAVPASLGPAAKGYPGERRSGPPVVVVAESGEGEMVALRVSDVPWELESRSLVASAPQRGGSVPWSAERTPAHWSMVVPSAGARSGGSVSSDCREPVHPSPAAL
ncbi:hypothetical protein [Longimycelium tulufanense]|nr:hypothetical protein [Longimycelium tulufanense]